jgi:hypothetical protein
MNKREHEGSFTARDEQGRSYEINRYREYLDARGENFIPGRLTLVTSDGKKVRRVKQGVYQIPGGPLVRSDSTDAP